MPERLAAAQRGRNTQIDLFRVLYSQHECLKKDHEVCTNQEKGLVEPLEDMERDRDEWKETYAAHVENIKKLES